MTVLDRENLRALHTKLISAAAIVEAVIEDRWAGDERHLAELLEWIRTLSLAP